MFDFLDLKSRHSVRMFPSFLAVSAVLLLSGVAEAKTVYVNGAISKPGKGATWATAYKYLRDALDDTKAGDVINVAKGTYYPDDGKTGVMGNREMSFNLNGQKIYGGFSGAGTANLQRNPTANPTILSGAIWGGANASDFYSLHVTVVEKDSTLDGFIVEDGHANGGHSWNYPNITTYDRGGASYIKSGKTLTLNNCIVRDNRALADGGAIMVEGGKGKVIATNCSFERNEIRLDYSVTTGNSGGGAISGDVDAVNCRFTGNTVAAVHPFESKESIAFGGAIAGNVTAKGCEFNGNKVYAFTFTDAKPDAGGGAVSGSFSGSYCNFSGNEAFASGGEGVSSGGAIRGPVVRAFNCVFVENMGGVGIEEEKTPVNGGGGAVHIGGKGVSHLANCVFVRNSSLFRGGAVQAGIDTAADSVFISNSTFLDNGVAEYQPGAALSCGGVVRSLNNIFWYTAPTDGSFNQDRPVHVSLGGNFRNSDENYPTPSSAGPNILKGGADSITLGTIASVFLVSPSVLVLDQDPLFANTADLDGPDNKWRTADDGLRLLAGSAAIGKVLDPRVSGFVNVLPKDLLDLDGDGNVNERLPVDLKGTVRVQNTFVEIGAYEYGGQPHVAEIAVFESNKELADGGARNFGNVARNKKKEMTFTIRSKGTNDLGGLTIALSGSKEFTLKKVKLDSLAPGSQATFTVIFRPKKAGKYSTKLSILSNDPDEASFDIKLTGKGTDAKSSGKKAGQGSGSKGSKPVDPVTSKGTTPSTFAAAAPANAANAVVTTTFAADGTKHLVLTVVKTAGWNGGTVEVSSDLLEWFSGKQHTTVLENSATLLRVRDNTPVSTGEKRYIRLK